MGEVREQSLASYLAHFLPWKMQPQEMAFLREPNKPSKHRQKYSCSGVYVNNYE
jgi:hypothetical protein